MTGWHIAVALQGDKPKLQPFAVYFYQPGVRGSNNRDDSIQSFIF